MKLDVDELGKWESQLRRGGLCLAVLAALQGGRLYGLEILRRLETGGGLAVQEGTIYPLLSRLKADGLVDAEWVQSDAGHPRKYYALTEAGRRRLRDMAAGWRTFAAGLDQLLRPLDGETR
jgi:PadR family transcriptional regulator PadR